MEYTTPHTVDEQDSLFAHWPWVRDELNVLAELVPLQDQRMVELGCGPARLVRGLLQRYPGSTVTGLEVDHRQLAKNLAHPQPGLGFVVAGAQAVPMADASLDGALMLKSLHHVPEADMDRALAEVARVLRPGGWLYVSEPVYAGALNEVVRLFNDEGHVRAAAQSALDRALAAADGPWRQGREVRFVQPVCYAGWDDFAQRMLAPSFADYRIGDSLRTQVRAAFERYRQRPPGTPGEAGHAAVDGAHFLRPMLARVLWRR